MSIRFGTNDIVKSCKFYDSTFLALSVKKFATPKTMPVALYKLTDGLMFIVGPALNGEPATYANGGTILFTAENEEAVNSWYTAGMTNGGTCEGTPGPRAKVQGRYGAYMRDPDGNKLGCYVGNIFE